MQIGALTSQFDVAEMVLATFVLFFLGLVVYLQRESNREGFPLRDNDGAPISSTGLTGIPEPKFFHLPSGETVAAPRMETHFAVSADAARRTAPFPGAPLEPAGDPMLAAMGPGSFAQRADVAEREFFGGGARIVPLRADPAYSLASEDPDIRGFAVLGADRVVAGTLHEVWIDRSEMLVRYYEVALSPAHGGRHVLLPSTMSDIKWDDRAVVVESILAAQFAGVPALKSMNEVTWLEEDQIQAYYAGGTIYATPARSEPVL